jgi:hypothetical protein
MKTAMPWRVRTKPIRELIPEGFLESGRNGEGGPEKIGELIPNTLGERAGRTGLGVGKHRLSRAVVPPK